MAEFSKDELGVIGFLCSCALDDTKKEIMKQKRRGLDTAYAEQLWVERFKLVYTKVIPDSWCGKKETLDKLKFGDKIG